MQHFFWFFQKFLILVLFYLKLILVYNKYYRRILMSWQWFVSQGFALIGLIFVVISTQQKTTKGIMIHRNIATISVFIGLCFLGNLSSIILCGVGILRNLIGLIFSIKKNTKQYVKIISGVCLVALLITLNIIFWKDWLNILSIVLGTMLIITFLQKSPKAVRIWTVASEVVSITYYGLLLSPINVGIEVFGLVSAIVGIIRLDINRKPKNLTEENVDAQNNLKEDETILIEEENK